MGLGFGDFIGLGGGARESRGVRFDMAMNWRWIVARGLLPPTLAWNVLLGRIFRTRNWWDEVDPHLILGARPFRRDVPKLAAMGVSGVVNLCEEFHGPTDLYQRFGIEQLWVPIIDFTHPTIAEVDQALAFIDRFNTKGKRVYLHCKAGRGRSGTVAICWLMESQHLSMADAQKLLVQRRPHVNPHLTDRPVVQSFAKRLESSRS